jgi:ankyrin repeat protein
MKGQQGKPTANDHWDWGVPDIQDPEQCEVLVGDVSKTLPKAHRLMKIRRNIGKLADWHGPASTEALCLARAIEIVMNTLFGDDTEKSFHWSIGSGDAKIQFRLERERQGAWKAFSDELEAALSLWLYSVYNSENSREEDNKGRKSADDDAWLRDKGTAPKPCLRLLDSHSLALERDLDWWMPNGDTRIIKIQYEPSNEIEVQPHRKVEVQPHRIKGFASYSIGYNKVKEMPVKNLLYFESTTETAADEAAHPENALNCILATKSYQPLKTFFAHNLFSTFMWAVAKKLKRPFHGRVEVRPADADNDGRDPTWQTFALHNAELSRMVQEIQSTGLGTLEDIYLSIIPPLSSRDKLPRADPIIQWTQKHALPHESMGHWEESASAYQWLFRKSQTFPKRDGISIKATALLMEQVRVVTENLKLKRAQQFEDESISELNKLRIRILNQLESADQATVGKLMDLASRLSRDLKFNVMLREPEPVLSEDDKNELQLTGLHKVAFSDWRLSINPYTVKAINSKDILDRTPLHYAAANGHILFFKRLVGHRPNINAQDIHGETPLHTACRQNAAGIVRRLLQVGADTSIRDMDGRGPLHYAAAYGDKNMIQALIEAGADSNLLDTQGKTPLLWAAYKGRHEAVEYLWKTTHTELRDQIGTTPLHLAVIGDAVNVEDKLRVVKLLVKKQPANIEARDRFGRTPLFVAVKAGKEAVVKLLLERGADIEVRDAHGNAPLHSAAKGGNEAAVELLLERGADKAAKNNVKETSLHLAAAEGQTAVAWVLIRCGADVEARDEMDRTPLCSASWRGQEAVASLLIRHGAAVEVRHQVERSPLHWAAEGGSKAVVWLLLFQGATLEENIYRRNPLALAARSGHVSVVQLLLNWGAKTRGEPGNKALHGAVMCGSTPMVELLLDRGAALEARDNRRRTPLTTAVRCKNKTMVELLLDRGAVIEAPGYDGKSPLIAAAEHGGKTVVELLLDRGAALEARDKSGMTPLIAAAKWQREAVIKLLLDRGANKAAITNDGKSYSDFLSSGN